MSNKFLLPCHDGRTVVVTTADAGRTVDCPCGKKVQVPTLRGVQSLPRVEEPGAGPSAPAWSAQQGAIFTSGLCVLLVGLVALGMFYNRFRQIETSKPGMNLEVLAQFELEAENAEAASTLTVWQLLRDNPLEERPLLVWEANRRVAQRYMVYMGVAGAIVAIGLGMAVAGPMMKPAPARPKAQRKPVARTAH